MSVAAFHDPRGYDVLPYKHNYTKEGTYVETAYFIPAYTIVTAPGYVDNRGWTDPEKGKEKEIKLSHNADISFQKNKFDTLLAITGEKQTYFFDYRNFSDNF